MHGLINRSIQCFVRDCYGEDIWLRTCRQADLGFDNFEAMLGYDDKLTYLVLDAVGQVLDRRTDGFLEDLGTYLVSHPNLENIRRLLRFGGDNFLEFLHSLDDLHDRVKLSLPDMDFPTIEMQDNDVGSYNLHFNWEKRGLGSIAVGVLRAMADDYGALVLLDKTTNNHPTGDHVIVTISLLEAQFSEGREFTLGGKHD